MNEIKSKDRTEKMKISPDRAQKILTGSIAIALVFVVGFVTFSYLRPKDVTFFSRTSVARVGTIEKYVSTTAVIVRDEKQIITPVGGSIDFLVNPYEKLPVNTPIAQITNSAVISAIAQSNVDTEELTKFINSKKLELSQNNDLLNEVRAQIAGKNIEMKSYEQNSDSKNMNRAQKELLTFKNKEVDILHEIAIITEAISSAEKELLKAGDNTITLSNEALKVLKNDSPIMISMSVDGLEDVLNPKNPDILDFVFDEKNYSVTSVADLDQVMAGQVVYREINNYKTYVLMRVILKENKLSFGSKVGVRFPELATEAVEGTIYSMKTIDESKNEYSVLVELERFPNSLVDLRTKRVQFVIKSYFGVVIPVTSVFREGDKAFVKVLKGNKFERREIEIVGTNDTETVVKGLSDGDKVLTSP